MPPFGKSLGDYLAFARVVLILTLIVGLGRIGLSLAGAPDDVTWWFSMTAVTLAAALYFGARVHTTGFGGYPQLLVLIVLANLTAGVVTAAGILLTPLTGIETILTRQTPSGEAVNHVVHAVTHLVGNPTFMALIFWILGALVLFVTKRVVRTAG